MYPPMIRLQEELPFGAFCADYGNPDGPTARGWRSFDNMLLSMFNVFHHVGTSASG
jgi:hypothetical protein